MEHLVDEALSFGFSHAAMLDSATLVLRTEVRDMCAANRCHLYGKSWMCPPALGSLEESAKAISGYRRGLIVQTTGELEDDFDYETMRDTGSKQKERIQAFRRVLEARYPNLLAMTCGGCELCDSCTYPDAPCRHPEDALSSMEAFGLVVSDVCRDNGIAYYYGPKTITYTGCYLF